MKTIVKEYSNDELTIVWQPHICIHAENCTKLLPNVYNPNIRPWIKAENASSADLKNQIDACPSGALSYKLITSENEVTKAITKVEVKTNGPLIVEGNLEVNKPDGTSEIRSKKTAFCRCGASSNKPFCDGSHTRIDFEG